MNDQEPIEALEKDEGFLTELEQKTISFPKVMALAVRNTISQDWIDYGGRAWLSTPGAERVARAVGFTIKDVKRERIDREDEKGKYYIYITTGKVGLERWDIWIDAIGTCSTRKAFHFLDKGRERELFEIDEGKIIKDSFSNMVENGTTRFMGLRGLPWEFLEKQGIQRSKVSRVDFKSGGERPKKQPKSKAGAGELFQGDEPISTDQAKMIRNLAAKKNISEDELCHVFELESLEKMTRKMLAGVSKFIAEYRI